MNLFMKYFVRTVFIFFVLTPIVGAMLSDEIEVLEAKLAKRKDEKAARKRAVRLAAKEQKLLATTQKDKDAEFIKRTAREEILRKCKEATLDREMPYLSIEEIENLINELKNRKE